MLDVIENVPAFDRAPAFLLNQITAYGATEIADIGGGAHPMLDEGRVRAHGLNYTVLDISEVELAKAAPAYRKVAVDMMADGSNFDRLVPPASFDLVFSHMFLEHIRDPAAVHQNVRSMLKPGGIAIHMFPSPNNLPLILNRLVPEFVSRMLVGAAQPDRDLGGIEGKFPAFYKFCGAPSHRLRAVYESFGFEVVEHVGYIGHDYYLRFPILRDVERRARRSLVRLSVPLTSVVLLVLRKPHAAADV